MCIRDRHRNARRGGYGERRPGADVAAHPLHHQHIARIERPREQAEQIADEIGGRRFIALPHQQRRPREGEQHRHRLPPARQGARDRNPPPHEEQAGAVAEQRRIGNVGLKLSLIHI